MCANLCKQGKTEGECTPSSPAVYLGSAPDPPWPNTCNILVEVKKRKKEKFLFFQNLLFWAENHPKNGAPSPWARAKAKWKMNIACAVKLDYINAIYLIDWSCGSEVQFPFLRSHFIASCPVIYNLYILKSAFFLVLYAYLPVASGKTGRLRQLSPTDQSHFHIRMRFFVNPLPQQFVTLSSFGLVWKII